MNFFETLVHHTVRDLDNADYVEDNAPFASTNMKSSYLGAGYYFWDNNLKLAHDWGHIHCDNNYMICEGDLKVDDDYFLDLVGNRQDQIWMSNCMNEVPELKGLTVGAAIEFLKDQQNKHPNQNIFRYKVIRAIDIAKTRYQEEYHKFVDSKKGLTTFNPKMIICLVTKNKLILNSLKIIFPEKYINE